MRAGGARYPLDCHAALAMNPSEAQDAARTQSAGDTRASSAKFHSIGGGGGANATGWLREYVIIKLVHSDKRPPPPIGYSSTGGELRPQQERSKFPSDGGVSAGRGGLLVGSRCSHCLVPIPAFAHPQNLAILRGPERE